MKLSASVSVRNQCRLRSAFFRFNKTHANCFAANCHCHTVLWTRQIRESTERARECIGGRGGRTNNIWSSVWSVAKPIDIHVVDPRANISLFPCDKLSISAIYRTQSCWANWLSQRFSSFDKPMKCWSTKFCCLLSWSYVTKPSSFFTIWLFDIRWKVSR